MSIIKELSAMKSIDLLDYLVDHTEDMEVKSVIQYIKCPYTRKFKTEELQFEQPLQENPSGNVNHKQYEDKQRKGLMLLLQQIKNMATEDIIGSIKKFSARLNSTYQSTLTSILTKELTFDITSEELKTVYPDTNIFKPAIGRKLESIEDVLPAQIFPVKKEFTRLISIVCLNFVKFYTEDGKEVESPEFEKDLIVLAGQIPMVFDGYMYNDYYLLNDAIIFGDFKRGKTRVKYEKRYKRLKEDVNEFHADPKVANKKIMVPSQFKLENSETWAVFMENVDKKKTYIVKSLDDTYEFFYEVSYK